jgi:hypothetical protein
MAVKLKTGRSAHEYHTQQAHYLYRRFNGFDIDQTVSGAGKFALGTLPAGAMPLECIVRVNAAFTSGEVIVGTSAAGSSALVVTTADVTSATTGTYVVDRYMGTYSTVDVPLYIQTKSTGATNGQVDVWLSYLRGHPYQA